MSHDKLACMLARAVSKLPRGGMRMVRWIASLSDGLQDYPLLTRYGTIVCDFRETVCFSLLRDGEYLHWREDEEALGQIPLGPNSVVLDIGANIGILTRLFAERAGEVHAFEPAPRAIRLLQANTKNLPNVTVHAVAISDRQGTCRFEEHEMLDMSGLSARGAGLEVSVTTVDALGLEPDFIKIDVEGYEKEVLRGAELTIRRQLPIIMFEALDDQARRDCEDLILAAHQDYRFEPMGGGINFIAWPKP